MKFGSIGHLHSSVSIAHQLLCDKDTALEDSDLLSHFYAPVNLNIHRSRYHGTTQASCSLKQGEPGGDGTPGPAVPDLPSQGPPTVSEWGEQGKPGDDCQDQPESPDHKAMPWQWDRSQVKLEIPSVRQG